MITVRLKIFASLRDICEFSEREIQLSDSMSVTKFLSYIVEQFPALKAQEESLLVALNEEYCDRNSLLKDGDVVAIFPPVSGG